MAERLGKRFPPTPGLAEAAKRVIRAHDAAERRQAEKGEGKMDGLEIVGKVESLALGPGDVVVVKVPEIISTSMARQIEESVQPYFPDNRVLALGGGAELLVARYGKREGDDA